MTFSKTDKSLTVVIVENGKSAIHTTTSSNANWPKILVALKNQNQNELVELMSVKKTVENFTESSVEIRDGNVFFKGRALHGADVSRLLEFVREGVPFLPLARFLERKAKNPSYRSVNELYKFLEHRGMPVTPEGKILGYKGVRDDFFSVMGNTATIMVSGETDSGGHIKNVVGADIRCERSCVCDDYKQGCSPGLHIGSLEYAKGWGPRVVIVEFDPADVVSVPDDCDCQKLRACAYKVVGEFTGKLPDAYSNSYNNNQEVVAKTEKPIAKSDVDYSDGDTNQEDEENDEVANYDDGFADGEADGRAHKAREFHVTDEDDTSIGTREMQIIKGYNDGYRFGRYGKK